MTIKSSPFFEQDNALLQLSGLMCVQQVSDCAFHSAHLDLFLHIMN